MTSGEGSGSIVKIGGRRGKNDSRRDEVKRGWDWRRGTKGNDKGEDVLRILRLALAQDMAKGWVGLS